MKSSVISHGTQPSFVGEIYGGFAGHLSVALRSSSMPLRKWEGASQGRPGSASRRPRPHHRGAPATRSLGLGDAVWGKWTTRPGSTSTKRELACTSAWGAKYWARHGEAGARTVGEASCPELGGRHFPSVAARAVGTGQRHEQQQRRRCTGGHGGCVLCRRGCVRRVAGTHACAGSRGDACSAAVAVLGVHTRLQKALQCQRRRSGIGQLHGSLPAHGCDSAPWALLAGVAPAEHPLLSAAPGARPKAQPMCRFQQTSGPLRRCTPFSKDPVLPGAGVDSPAYKTPTPREAAAPCAGA
ncbi:uncharacterized protein LOC118606818 [Rousettus aegyptiacus]|uniref:uncharacterized protein LOC118606818 n=1 Tax=Rousettus aegyptiacus TaxID=9407 RepID=UPI00168D1B07|nr:uncharacterized protein LOC118606818 [Rousettus aegyptiacus]XP_036082010.1 uncharacterized protein LOC118606818 [Rousettus aegyptiacus]